jgi:hypothetical protein
MTGDVSSNEGGLGDPASATLYIASAPTIGAAFGAPSIKVGQTTPLTFTIANPNMVQGFTGLGFSDSLPVGLVVATPSGASDSCGGTLSATPGGSGIALSGGSLPAGAGCTVVVNVAGVAGGIATSTTTPVTANEGGTGNAASASITVIPPAATGPSPTGGRPFVVITGVAVHHDGSTTLTVLTSAAGGLDVLETAGSSHQTAAAPLKPGPGRFSFAFKHFANVSAGKHILRITPGQRGKRLVRHHRGKALLNVWVRFFGSGQAPVTAGKLHLRLP